MKVRINYHSIPFGAHIFATPSFTHSEIVECESLNDPKLIAYIESKKDMYGASFKKEDFMGYQFTSNQGGVQIAEYVQPTTPKILVL